MLTPPDWEAVGRFLITLVIGFPVAIAAAGYILKDRNSK